MEATIPSSYLYPLFRTSWTEQKSSDNANPSLTLGGVVVIASVVTMRVLDVYLVVMCDIIRAEAPKNDVQMVQKIGAVFGTTLCVMRAVGSIFVYALVELDIMGCAR
jgi:hypothetical protein